MKKAAKEKKYIVPNECSVGRWIAVLIVGLLLGCILSIPLFPFMQNTTDAFMGIPYTELFGILAFAPMFWGMVIAVKVLGKTSLREFVLGIGGKVNKKECLTVFGLFAAGFLMPHLLILDKIHLRGTNPGEFGFLLLFMLLVTWMQTTWEELIFRGIVIRWVCGNKVGYTKKAVIAGIVSTLAFALAHAPNPEVTSQKGIQMLMVLSCYMIPGMVCYIADLHFGSLLPGIIIHWVNNFALFTLISSDVSALSFPSLLVDNSPSSAAWTVASTAMAYLPVLVYILLDLRRRRAGNADGAEGTL